MKVDIAHQESSKGLIFKKPLYGVSLSVVFSEEEQQIIKQHKLKDRIVLSRPLSADLNYDKWADHEDKFYLRISTLMNGEDVYYSDAPSDAKEYEEHLVAALRDLKEFLDENAEVGEARSFEL